jgi:hypothetical protein
MSLILYFAAIMIDGDWMNDWITHLPAMIRPVIMQIGQILAFVVGRES